MKRLRRCGRVVLACSALAMLAACSGQAHIGFSAYTDACRADRHVDQRQTGTPGADGGAGAG